MIDDGTQYQHDLTGRGHYDQVWAMLHGSDVKMLGEHEYPGGQYVLHSERIGHLGEVTFTEGDKPEFLAGTWFGGVTISGRTRTRRQALADFLDEIATTHPRRAR